MQNLVDLPGFEWGPPPESQAWYGLWSPLTDCFILVGHNISQLKFVQALTMGKYLTVLLELDTKFYRNSMIDNSCATGWTVTDPEVLNFPAVLKQKNFIMKIENIQPSCVKDPDTVNYIQQWFLFVWYWVKWLDSEFNVEITTPSILAFGIGTQNTLQGEIYRVLFLEHDPDQAQNKIENILSLYV